MVEGALDLLIMIFVLAACLSVCMGLMVPIVKDSKQLVYDEIYNKSVDKLAGDRILPSSEFCVPASKITLCSMGQKSFMPEPRQISIAGTYIDVGDTGAPGAVDDGYAARRVEIGNKVYGYIATWFTSFKASDSYDKILNPPTSLETSSITVDGKEINTTALFTFMYDDNNTEDESDDSYALFIKLTENKPFAAPQLYKCLSGGRLKSKEGNII